MQDEAQSAVDAAAITETPEFKAAVDAAVNQVRDELLATFSKAAVTSNVGGEGLDMARLFSQMAMSIAEISDPGNKTRRVAPEVLRAREEAHQRMVDLIKEAKDKGLRPEYRAIGTMFLNERWIQPFKVDPATKKPKPVEFYWTGVPNLVMRPLNDIAKRIFAEFKASIGSTTEDEKAPKHWITGAGIVIKGDAGPRSRGVVIAAEDGAAYAEGAPERNDFDDEFALKAGDDPTAKSVRVLGTVAAPARQNWQDSLGDLH